MQRLNSTRLRQQMSSMYVVAAFYFTAAAAVAVATCLQLVNVDAPCPETYWDAPSRHCSDVMHNVLDEVRLSGRRLTTELRFNKTCHAWQRTSSCYQELIRLCQHDIFAVHELNQHINRYSIYSLPCTQDSDLLEPDEKAKRLSAFDCLLTELKTTRRCTEAVDRYLRRFINRQEYRSACRIISTAIKCFDDVKLSLERRCQQDDVSLELYHTNYIWPLVEHTRQTVLTQCSLSTPYSDYYRSSSSTSVIRPFNNHQRLYLVLLHLVSSCLSGVLLLTVLIVNPSSAL
jgi:hypothetical protein